jgi:hypothetical protein
MKIRVTKSDFDLICQIVDNNQSYFTSEEINAIEIVLSFHDLDKAYEFDDLIKDKLVYQGFDINYNPNQFGRMCENLIDKMYDILK